MGYPAEYDEVELAVRRERYRQDQKFGEQNHPDGTGRFLCKEKADHYREQCDAAFNEKRGTWYDVLLEEVHEAFAETEPEKLKTELIQVMAVCKAWIECIERRKEHQLVEETDPKLYAKGQKMTKKEYLQFHRDCCDKMVKITEAKNADYTGTGDDPFANFTRVEVLGISDTTQGFLTRMLDKFCRLISFQQRGELLVKDESVEDSLLDLANYCVLLAGYLRSKNASNQKS